MQLLVTLFYASFLPLPLTGARALPDASTNDADKRQICGWMTVQRDHQGRRILYNTTQGVESLDPFRFKSVYMWGCMCTWFAREGDWRVSANAKFWSNFDEIPGSYECEVCSDCSAAAGKGEWEGWREGEGAEGGVRPKSGGGSERGLVMGSGSPL